MTQSTNPIHIGIIGGTGLGERLVEAGFIDDVRSEVAPATPFGSPSGPILQGRLPDGTPVSMLARHGEGHRFNPRAVPYRANVFAFKALGVTHLIASGATGSLQEHIHPGQIVLVDQFIDRTDGRDRTFYERAAVHVEFSEPTCPVMQSWLIEAAKRTDIHLHERGTYVCMEGPAFSTRAESEMHRQWGGDVIGMTALPEAKLAREAEIAYALIALPTDYDCWKRPEVDGSDSDEASSSILESVLANLNRAADASVKLISEALTDVSRLAEQPSPGHTALAMAIWSDRSAIDSDEVERLGVLWSGCFE